MTVVDQPASVALPRTTGCLEATEIVAVIHVRDRRGSGSDPGPTQNDETPTDEPVEIGPADRRGPAPACDMEWQPEDRPRDRQDGRASATTSAQPVGGRRTARRTRPAHHPRIRHGNAARQ